MKKISKRLYKNTNFENCLNLGYLIDFGGLRYNDKFFNPNMRGFRELYNNHGNI